jgi:hypothetical protein
VSAAEDLYKSSRRQASIPAWRLTMDDRDQQGRFVPRYSGKVCDRIGCDDPIEGPGRRFCVEHRREHGRRLLGQLQAAAGEAPARRTGGAA